MEAGDREVAGPGKNKQTARLFIAGPMFLCLFLMLIPSWEVIHI